MARNNFHRIFKYLISEHEFEGVVAVAVLLVQGPPDVLVQLLQDDAFAFGHLPQDPVHRLGLVVAILAGRDPFWVHSPLRQVDVALLLVDPQHHHHLRSWASARESRESAREQGNGGVNKNRNNVVAE